MCAEKILVEENLAVSEHTPYSIKLPSRVTSTEWNKTKPANRQLGSGSREQQVPARTLGLDVSLQAQLSHIP